MSSHTVAARALNVPASRLVACALLLVAVGCNRPTSGPASSTAPVASAPRPPLPEATIGIQVSPAMALVMVANDKGFFREEGVNVTLKEFTAGKFALQAFLGGSIDFAVAGEVPVCLAALQGNQTRVVTQVVQETKNEVRVIAHRDGTLNDPKAWFASKRRKLATSFGGGPEFFTYSFLNFYGIPRDSVEVLSLTPADMPAALATKSVDAVAIFDPFAFIAEQKLGADGITFSDEKIYSELYVLVATPAQAEASDPRIAAILRGLVRAAGAIESDPAEAKSIVVKYTKLDPPVVDGIWGNFVFKPALTTQLLDFWTREADWARAIGTVPSNAPAVDLRRIIDERHLRAVAADAVTLQ